MAAIGIVGDGPGGLGAALFLAKNGQRVTVYGDDQTAMHYAHLRNYLGVPEITGSEFQEIAVAQVTGFGADLRKARVIAVDSSEEGLRLRADDGSVEEVAYLVLAEGRNAPLIQALGLDEDESGITVDSEFRTSMPRVYAVGRAARPSRSQAIISAGAGAIAALDILAEVTGEDFQDWDSPD